MKAAFLIVDEADALVEVYRALVAVGASETASGVQLVSPDGFLFNVDKDDGNPVVESDWRTGLAESGRAYLIPDVAAARAVLISCRSEAVFVSYVSQVVARIPGRAWVLDGNDVLWPAEDIDPERLVL